MSDQKDSRALAVELSKIFSETQALLLQWEQAAKCASLSGWNTSRVAYLRAWQEFIRANNIMQWNLASTRNNLYGRNLTTPQGVSELTLSNNAKDSTAYSLIDSPSTSQPSLQNQSQQVESQYFGPSQTVINSDQNQSNLASVSRKANHKSVYHCGIPLKKQRTENLSTRPPPFNKPCLFCRTMNEHWTSDCPHFVSVSDRQHQLVVNKIVFSVVVQAHWNALCPIKSSLRGHPQRGGNQILDKADDTVTSENVPCDRVETPPVSEKMNTSDKDPETDDNADDTVTSENVPCDRVETPPVSEKTNTNKADDTVTSENVPCDRVETPPVSEKMNTSDKDPETDDNADDTVTSENVPCDRVETPPVSEKTNTSDKDPETDDNDNNDFEIDHDYYCELDCQ